MEVPGLSADAVFPNTHWSVVLAAGQSTSARKSEALEQLCRAYWFPLYWFVRRQGYRPEEAQDLTQGFFAHLLENNGLARADAERGRFRTFLLSSLQNFLGHEWERARAEKRGGGREFISWEKEAAEDWYQLELNPGLTPDQLFDQRWALTLFRHALARLQKESAESGKSAQFDELKAFLSSDPGEGAYAAVASRLGMTSAAVAVAVHRLRQRYRELVRQEIAQTVPTVAEVDEEMRYLVALVST